MNITNALISIFRWSSQEPIVTLIQKHGKRNAYRHPTRRLRVHGDECNRKCTSGRRVGAVHVPGNISLIVDIPPSIHFNVNIVSKIKESIKSCLVNQLTMLYPLTILSSWAFCISAKVSVLFGMCKLVGSATLLKATCFAAALLPYNK